MSTTWPVRDRLIMAACPMIRPRLQHVLPGRRDESRRVVADDSHERGREHLHQLPGRSRSAQQQAEHVHLLVATRLVAEPFEQQRQLKPVLPSSRGRRRAVRTRHQRICDIHATFHTRGRRRRTNDIANAPFWQSKIRYEFSYTLIASSGCGGIRTAGDRQRDRSPGDGGSRFCCLAYGGLRRGAGRDVKQVELLERRQRAAVERSG